MASKYTIGDIFSCVDGSQVRFLEKIDRSFGWFQCLKTQKTFKINMWNVFKNKAKNPYALAVHGIGFLGQGHFNAHSPSYAVWTGMLGRTYGGAFPNYSEVQVHTDWHDFQQFSNDYSSLLQGVSFSKPQLDKDLKAEGRRGLLYSAATCLLLPHQINTALQLINQYEKVEDCPYGVSLHSLTGKYKAQMSYNGRNKYLGIYTTAEQALEVYCLHKSNYIVELADRFRSNMPSETYDLLLLKAKDIKNNEY